MFVLHFKESSDIFWRIYCFISKSVLIYFEESSDPFPYPLRSMLKNPLLQNSKESPVFFQICSDLLQRIFWFFSDLGLEREDGVPASGPWSRQVWWADQLLYLYLYFHLCSYLYLYFHMEIQATINYDIWVHRNDTLAAVTKPADLGLIRL